MPVAPAAVVQSPPSPVSQPLLLLNGLSRLRLKNALTIVLAVLPNLLEIEEPPGMTSVRNAVMTTVTAVTRSTPIVMRAAVAVAHAVAVVDVVVRVSRALQDNGRSADGHQLPPVDPAVAIAVVARVARRIEAPHPVVVMVADHRHPLSHVAGGANVAA